MLLEGHQQHETQAKKPGMMLADAPFRRHRMLGAAFVGMTAIAKQIQHALGGWRQGRPKDPAPAS